VSAAGERGEGSEHITHDTSNPTNGSMDGDTIISLYSYDAKTDIVSESI